MLLQTSVSPGRDPFWGALQIVVARSVSRVTVSMIVVSAVRSPHSGHGGKAPCDSSRSAHERIRIGSDVALTVPETNDLQTRLGVGAPRNVTSDQKGSLLPPPQSSMAWLIAFAARSARSASVNGKRLSKLRLL
jgi:Global regulator protein family